MAERVRAALFAALATCLPAASAPAQTTDSLRYTAAGLDCARLEEVTRTEIETQTARRAGEGATGRRGIWSVRAADTAGAIAVEAWYDSLSVWRRTDAGHLEPDTDGVIGGRFRGRLSPTGRYDAIAAPFVPDEVAEVADVSTALDDLFPPLPQRPLRPGASWRAPGVVITRLPDTTASASAPDGRRLVHLEVRLNRETKETVPRGDTVPIPLSQTTSESGEVLWDPAFGLVSRSREIVVETTIPAGGRVRMPVRSRVVQHTTLTRLPDDPSCRGRAGW